MNQDPFKEYLVQTEPSKRDKRYAWNTAIGLQAVDGLKPSNVFGRSDVKKIIQLGNTRISAMLKKMAEENLIESVSGYGKGKYRFCSKFVS